MSFTLPPPKKMSPFLIITLESDPERSVGLSVDELDHSGLAIHLCLYDAISQREVVLERDGFGPAFGHEAVTLFPVTGQTGTLRINSTVKSPVVIDVPKLIR